MNYRLCIALYAGKFSSGANQKQSFETIDLENIERHQKPGMDFWCLFLLSKIQNLGKGSKYKRKEKRDNSKKIEVCRMRNMEQEKEGRHA